MIPYAEQCTSARIELPSSICEAVACRAVREQRGGPCALPTIECEQRDAATAGSSRMHHCPSPVAGFKRGSRPDTQCLMASPQADAGPRQGCGEGWFSCTYAFINHEREMISKI